MDLRDTRFSFGQRNRRGAFAINRLRFASNSYPMLRISKTRGSKGKRQRRKQYSAVLSICTTVYAVQGDIKLFKAIHRAILRSKVVVIYEDSEIGIDAAPDRPAGVTFYARCKGRCMSTVTSSGDHVPMTYYNLFSCRGIRPLATLYFFG